MQFGIAPGLQFGRSPRFVLPFFFLNHLYLWTVKFDTYPMIFMTYNSLERYENLRYKQFKKKQDEYRASTLNFKRGSVLVLIISSFQYSTRVEFSRKVM